MYRKWLLIYKTGTKKSWFLVSGDSRFSFQFDNYQVYFRHSTYKSSTEYIMLLMCLLTVVKSLFPSYSNSFIPPQSFLISSASSWSAGTLRHEGLSDLGPYTSRLLFLHLVNRHSLKCALIFQEHVKKMSAALATIWKVLEVAG